MMEFDLDSGDFSLFNGELLPEYGDSEVTSYEGLKVESSINEAVTVPLQKTSAQETLAHPQNGSQELGLQDLLTESPRQDLPDLFPDTPAWLDQKTDLVDILTGVHPTPQENVQQVIQDTSLPQQPLDAYSDLLLADLSEDIFMTPSPQEEDTSVSVVVCDAATLPSDATDAHMDYLDALSQAGLGLDQLLANAPDPNTASLFDAPVLSPVSADEVESILSSSPPSPSQDATLASLFKSFSGKPATLDDQLVEEVLHVGPQRASREKARAAPYEVSSSKSPAISTRKPKADRRERKKEQNRTAALRYREKKRSEQDILQQEADELMEKNKVLRDKADSISREIKYLKDLMAEVKKARSKAKRGAS